MWRTDPDVYLDGQTFELPTLSRPSLSPSSTTVSSTVTAARCCDDGACACAGRPC
jgi:hypothetical protein